MASSAANPMAHAAAAQYAQMFQQGLMQAQAQQSNPAQPPQGNPTPQPPTYIQPPNQPLVPPQQPQQPPQAEPAAAPAAAAPAPGAPAPGADPIVSLAEKVLSGQNFWTKDERKALLEIMSNNKELQSKFQDMQSKMAQKQTEKIQHFAGAVMALAQSALPKDAFEAFAAKFTQSGAKALAENDTETFVNQVTPIVIAASERLFATPQAPTYTAPTPQSLRAKALADPDMADLVPVYNKILQASTQRPLMTSHVVQAPAAPYGMPMQPAYGYGAGAAAAFGGVDIKASSGMMQMDGGSSQVPRYLRHLPQELQHEYAGKQYTGPVDASRLYSREFLSRVAEVDAKEAAAEGVKRQRV